MAVSPMEIWIKNQKPLEKPEVGILNSDLLIWFLQWQFFVGMKLTLHKSRVHSYSVMQWWACSSLMPIPCLQRRVAKVASGLFYCWSLLRNNTVATHLQRFTLNYVSRRFVAWDSWTHTSWQVMERASDMLIGYATSICTLWKEAWVSL